MEEREGGGGGTARRAVRIDGWGLYVWQPADDGRPCTRRRQLATPVPRAPCRATCCQPAFICMHAYAGADAGRMHEGHGIAIGMDAHHLATQQDQRFRSIL